MIIATALICAVLTYGMALYHLTLILGAPLGEAVLGGQHKILPFKFRLISLSCLIIFSFIATLYLIKANLITISMTDLLIIIVLSVYTAFNAYAIVFNFWFSKSKKEKFIMGPITVVCFLSSLVFLILSFI